MLHLEFIREESWTINVNQYNPMLIENAGSISTERGTNSTFVEAVATDRFTTHIC